MKKNTQGKYTNRIPQKSILEALKQERRWVLWCFEDRGGKPTKVPYQANGAPARVNDPSTWTDYHTAQEALLSRFAGVGIVLGDGLIGIDLDWKESPVEGVPRKAWEIIRRFSSYAEWSPSGKGAHILLLGELPDGCKNRAYLGDGVHLEIYGGGRYFTFTGEAINTHDITAQPEQLTGLLSELGLLPTPPTPSQEEKTKAVSPESDAELLARMFGSKHGAEIWRLWGGDWDGYPSQSEADLALVSYLLWWTKGDTDRAERLFRQSRLYRPKWDERHSGTGQTYGEMTLEKALRGLSGGYSPTPFGVGRITGGEKHPLGGLSGGGEVLPGYPRYAIVGGEVCMALLSKRGEVREVSYAPLANFSAVIRREISASDGVESETLFEIEGYRPTGEPLPRVRVKASEFAAMDWPLTHWGTLGIVRAIPRGKDLLREAILRLSEGRTERATVYRHTGWAKIGERWAYLHAGGAITAEEPAPVEVELGRPLSGFVLPDPPAKEKERERAVQLAGLLFMGEKVAIPLLLYTLTAPLGYVPFSLYLVGPTGVGKTSVGLVFQSCFGYRGPGVPIGWESTANALEGIAFQAKDCLLLVDDFVPQVSERATNEQGNKAARVLRAQGNAVGRARMRVDGTLAGDRPPRGALLITGEMPPPGHSIRARTLFVEVSPRDIDFEVLGEAQGYAEEGIYAEAMAAWIRFLAKDPEGYRQKLKELAKEARTQVKGAHKRTVDAVARLWATWSLYKEYALSVGLDDLAAADPRVWEVLSQLAGGQEEYQRGADHTERFQELLFAALRMGRCHLAPLGMQKNESVEQYLAAPSLWGWRYDQTGGVWKPQGPEIGWIPQEWGTRGIYLDPAAAFSVVNELGKGIFPDARELWRHLAEKGLARTAQGKGGTRYTVTARIKGMVIRVVHLLPAALPSSSTGGEREGEEARPGSPPL